MSEGYKIRNQSGIYFITFAIVEWIDVFTRRSYAELVVESLQYCQQEKGLIIHGWCLMSNHIHLIVRAKEGNLSDVLRDLKRHTSKAVLRAIIENPQESRKEWMLAIFKKAGEYNSNNKNHQFWRQDNKPIELYSSEVIDSRINYIHQNPVVQGMVERPEDYIYGSAKDYSGEKGMLEIEVL